MGVCILEANFEGKGWSSRLLPILLILTWESRYPQKWGVNRKRGGVLEAVLPWKGQMTYSGEGKNLPGGPGVGENNTN